MKSTSDTPFKAITVRIPKGAYERLSEYAAARSASLNSIVAEAVAQYQVRIDRELAITGVRALQAQLRDGHGEGTDSAGLLRRIRETRSGGASHAGPPCADLTGGATSALDGDGSGKP